MSVHVSQHTVGPLAENCWMLVDTESKKAVLVDPGDEASRLLQAVRDAECTLEAIWLTHAHFDHVGAVADILKHQEVPVHLHPLDVGLYAHAANAAQHWGIAIPQPPLGTVDMADGSILHFGGVDFAVWHLPGHAPGHVAFIGGDLCISGDVLFAGSIGRTDLPFCDPTAMQASLARMATLPPSMRVLCGHGEETTIARENRSNPFLRGRARPVGA